MLETKKLFAAGLALASLAATGCYDFEKAYEECATTGRCTPSACKPELADPPDDSFFDSNCDGVDGTASAAFFVDPSSGLDTNAGTREAPFKSLPYALGRAADEGKALYLAQGTFDAPALRMDKPVSLYGGYAGVDGGWARGANYTTLIGGGSIGLTVSGLGEDAGVVIERLHITSAQAVDAGAPSIGVRVLDSSGVRLRYVEVLAGAGAAGAPGSSPPANTQGGADGGVGQSTLLATAPARADGGSAGVGGCGASYSFLAGVGGQGGDNFSASANGGAGIPSADGGIAGQNQSVDCPGTCQCIGNPGGKGQDGLEGDAGTEGPAGDGIGSLLDGTWVAHSGTVGGSGVPGGGGGGGGGGGYCIVNSVSNVSSSEGGGGGGGGTGGCPGAGAQGGSGGGASIALLLINGRVELDSAVLKTAGGGQGGTGGTGGVGGPGGRGGAGGTAYTRTVNSTSTLVATGGTGGAGGSGGVGGRGGHGGNGGGGPSVGIWCDPSSSFSQQGTSFDLGPAGQPGGGPGPKDSTSLRAESYQCPPAP